MLFVQDQYQYLVAPSMHQQNYTAAQFANGEYALALAEKVSGKQCLVVGSLTAPAEQVLQLLLLLTTLRQSRASQVILFSAYLGYQRQDALIADKSCGLQFADKLLQAAGVNQVITLEAHSLQALSNLAVPVTSLSAGMIFEQEITDLVAAGFGLVFPDGGAQLRYDWLVQKFPMAHHGYFSKKRSDGAVHLTNFYGKVGTKMIIYDDILDSGVTLIESCIALRSIGVQEIVIFVTHGFFHAHAWQNLFDLGVVMLHCTNSVPVAHTMRHPKIKVHSINFLLQNFI